MKFYISPLTPEPPTMADFRRIVRAFKREQSPKVSGCFVCAATPDVLIPEVRAYLKKHGIGVIERLK